MRGLAIVDVQTKFKKGRKGGTVLPGRGTGYVQ